MNYSEKSSVRQQVYAVATDSECIDMTTLSVLTTGTFNMDAPSPLPKNIFAEDNNDDIENLQPPQNAHASPSNIMHAQKCEKEIGFQ